MTQREHNWTAFDSEGQSHDWHAYPFPAEEGFELMTELAALIGAGASALGKFRVQSVGDLMDTDIDGEAIARGIDGMMTKLGDKGALQLARRLLRYTSRDGRKFAYGPADRGDGFYTFDAAFICNYGELREALVAVARFNFASFFGGFGPGRSE